MLFTVSTFDSIGQERKKLKYNKAKFELRYLSIFPLFTLKNVIVRELFEVVCIFAQKFRQGEHIIRRIFFEISRLCFRQKTVMVVGLLNYDVSQIPDDIKIFIFTFISACTFILFIYIFRIFSRFQRGS